MFTQCLVQWFETLNLLPGTLGLCQGRKCELVSGLKQLSQREDYDAGVCNSQNFRQGF